MVRKAYLLKTGQNNMFMPFLWTFHLSNVIFHSILLREVGLILKSLVNTRFS